MPTCTFACKYNCSPPAWPSVIRSWIKRGREFQSPMPLMYFEVLLHTSVWVCACVFSHVDVCPLCWGQSDCVWMNNSSSCSTAYGSRVDWYECVRACVSVSSCALGKPTQPFRGSVCPPHRKSDYGTDRHSTSLALSFPSVTFVFVFIENFFSSLLIFSLLCLSLSTLLSSPLLFSCNFPRHGVGSGSGSGSDVQVFPMQPHRRVFVSPLGFGGPHGRAVPHSTDSTMGLYAAKAPLPHITPSCFPSQGHREAQGAPRHQNANPFRALSLPSLPLTYQQSQIHMQIQWERFAK